MDYSPWRCRESDTTERLSLSLHNAIHMSRKMRNEDIRAVGLNWGLFCPSGDIWQPLGTFLVVTTKGRGCYWLLVVETRDAAKQPMLLLLLLSRFSSVRCCATPKTAAYQAPPSLGVSRQEHWSGLPFPSPMHESENSK